ncbi:MAG: tetratricopeptide repeat protein, partial [Patescibacteria group bacterium]
TIGILGSLLWLVLMVWVGFKSVGRLLFDRDHESWKMTYVLFVGWMILALSSVVYATNFTLAFLLCGLTGLLAAQVMTRIFKTDFSASPKLGLAASFGFVLVAVGVLGAFFLSGSRYMADVAFAKAVKLDQTGKADIQLVINELAKAVRYNGANDVYYRNLSSALLVKTSRTIVALKGEQPTADQTKEITGYVTAAVNAAVKATQIEPNNVDNWSVLGSVYVNVMSFAQGAEDQAAQAYLNAIRLEPTNPVHRTNLGRVYMTVADRARALVNSKNADLAKAAVEQEKTNLATAEQAFVSAIQMKNDYLPAHYYLAAVYERQGKLMDAAVRMQDISKNSPSDIGVGFEFAQLLLRLQKFDLAQAELERIITINAKYSNALWYLASVYEIQKKQDQAIAMVQKVVELNPDNKPAQDRLAKLKAGESTTQIPPPLSQDEKSASAVDTSAVEPVAPADTDDSEDETATTTEEVIPPKKKSSKR